MNGVDRLDFGVVVEFVVGRTCPRVVGMRADASRAELVRANPNSKMEWNSEI